MKYLQSKSFVVLGLALSFALCSHAVAQTTGESDQKEKAKQETKKKEAPRELNPNLTIIARAMTMVQGNTPLIKELELLDYQIKQMQQLQYDMAKAMAEISKSNVGKDRNERIDALNNYYRDYEIKLGEILLPHQLKRLKQITFQSVAMDAKGNLDYTRLLFDRSVMKALDVDIKTFEKLRAKTIEERQKLNEEIERLKRESEERILAVLDKEKRLKLETMLGERFDFEGYRLGSGGRFSKVTKEDK